MFRMCGGYTIFGIDSEAKLSNWFTLASWNIAKGDEILWKHFEDIRRALFILMTAQTAASVYEESWSADAHYDDPPVNGYAIGSIVGNEGMFWVSTINQTTHEEPTKAGWMGTSWLPYADSDKYLHHCVNSLYRTAYYCSHTGFEGWYFPEAYRLLPSQVWPLTNCGFTPWENGHDYKVGEKISVTDSVFAYQGMSVGYICTGDHLSASGNKPIANFTSPSTGGYWEQYGEHVVVSTKPFISDNAGTKNPDHTGDWQSFEGQAGWRPYHILSGWPDDGNFENELHTDSSFAEYQAAVERACEGPWVFFTDAWGGVVPYFWESVYDIWDKPPIAGGVDYNWDANGSSFELILKMMNKFDWVWDYQFFPHSGNPSYHCDWCGTHGHEGHDAHPVWRRTWRYAMTPQGLRTLRDHYNISSPHNGQYPPSEPTTPDDATAHTNHTLKDWHANPFADCLNDMKEALCLCERIHLDWGISGQWFEKRGNPAGCPYPQTSYSGFISDENSYMLANLAAEEEWSSGNGTLSWSVESDAVFCDGSLCGEGAGSHARWEFRPCFIDPVDVNAVKLTLTMATPPRRAGSAGGGIMRVTSGNNISDSWQQHPTGAYQAVSYPTGASWGGEAVGGDYEAGHYRRVAISFPSGGGTTSQEWWPSGACTPIYSLPPGGGCSEPDCPKHGGTTRAEITGSFQVEPTSFYLNIDKDFAIM